jgi:Ser/Thr protein kinase RdoA (MazF antagonist)
MRLEGHVLKYYSDRTAFCHALAGLRTSSALRSVSTPKLEGSLPELLLTVQSHVGGRPCDSPPAVAAEAGRALRRLHGAGLEGLPEFPPAAQLEGAAGCARLVAHIVPELAPRLEALLAKLEADLPGALPRVAAHGDFNVRQLLDGAHGLVLTDFDAMCAAPAALDHASYFAHLIRGYASPFDDAMEVLETLLEGYGDRPDELPWYLATTMLRRAARPFRYQDEHWPERMEQMVATAEAVAP